ncbi:WXG100 family type VII secretion target [Saccharothrix sp. ST-888]|uniref:WXG100 family type VII secretion target n=1 Tax=Saccharothrix sp. ST-888 TaxID=1427391 RepID=UPI0006979769|nr:WXG100 family type VII secretion target [Saccharothrix sp. ST-888]
MAADKTSFDKYDLVPLKGMLESSNPGRLKEVSDHWKSVEAELRSAATDLQQAVQHATQNWEGTASQGFVRRAGEIQTSMTNTADHAASTSTAINFAGTALDQAASSMKQITVPSSVDSGLKFVSDLGDRSDAQFKADLAGGMDRFAAVNKNYDQLSATEISHQYAIGVMEQLGPQYTQAAGYLNTPGESGYGGREQGFPPKPENPAPVGVAPEPMPSMPHNPTPQGPGGSDGQGGQGGGGNVGTPGMPGYQPPNLPPQHNPTYPTGPVTPGHPGGPGGPVGSMPPIVPPAHTGIDSLPPAPTVPPGTGSLPGGGLPGGGVPGGGLPGGGLPGGGVPGGGLPGGGFPGGLPGGGLPGGGLPGGGRPGGGRTVPTGSRPGAGSTGGGGAGAGAGAGRGAAGGAGGSGAGAAGGAGAGQGRPGMPGMGGAHAGGAGAGGKGAAGKGGSGLVRRSGGTVGGARPGSASGRAFTEGGSGLGKARANGTQGAAGAHGAPGGAAGNKKKGKNGNRPDYLVEDEDTWRTGGSANPPVIE